MGRYRRFVWLLVAACGDALLYKKLAALVDVPLPHGLAELQWRGAPRAAWTAWCEVVGRDDFLDRPSRWQ